MRLQRIMLIRESGERDLTKEANSGRETATQFSCNIHPSDGKPWPYEIDVMVELGTDNASDSLSDVRFSYEVLFAAQFEGLPDSLEPDAGTAIETVWPYVRPYILDGLTRYGLPTHMVPLNVVTDDSSREDEQ